MEKENGTINDLFFKFPSTPHLIKPESIDIRGDKVLSETERKDFLQHELVVEEKIDGANLGISFDSEGNLRVQNRGSYISLPASGQWKKLEAWLAPKIDILFEYLTNQYILFGEWCYARHSVFYSGLPDWFLGFDIYDKQTHQFLSTSGRDEKLKQMNIEAVPRIAQGHFSLADLKRLLTQSKLTPQPAEGLYLRQNKGSYLEQRAKLVRPAFIQAVEEHWSRSGITPNQLTD